MTKLKKLTDAVVYFNRCITYRYNLSVKMFQDFYVQSQTTKYVCTMQCVFNFLLRLDNRFVSISYVIAIITTYFKITRNVQKIINGNARENVEYLGIKY